MSNDRPRLEELVGRLSPFTMNPWLGLSYLVAAGVAYGLDLGWWALLVGLAGPIAYTVLYVMLVAVIGTYVMLVAKIGTKDE